MEIESGKIQLTDQLSHPFFQFFDLLLFIYDRLALSWLGRPELLFDQLVQLFLVIQLLSQFLLPSFDF